MADNMANLKRAGAMMESRMNDLQLTRQIVANELGISEMTISRLFRGQTTSPSLEMTVRVGAALEFMPNEVAQMYGYWAAKGPIEDQRIARAAEVAANLQPTEREHLLGLIEIAAINAEIRSRKK